jgi:imidazolonepropionase
MNEGVTTLEIKSGYGLTLEDEARCLRVARQLGADRRVDVRTTFLGAHALPPEFEGRPDDYISAVCQWLPHCTPRAWSMRSTPSAKTSASPRRRPGACSRPRSALGLPVKLHAEQLSDQGGAALAASFGALSCDHLEHLSDQASRP